MKKLLKPLFTALFAGMVCTGAKAAEPQVINIRTNDLSMVMSVAPNGEVLFHHFGGRIDDASPAAGIKSYRRTDHGTDNLAYSTMGGRNFREPALRVTHADGDMNTELRYVSHTTRTLADTNVTRTVIKLTDTNQALDVELFYTAYAEENVITTHAVIRNREKGSIVLHSFYSSSLPVKARSYLLTHLYGAWARESQVDHTLLTHGSKSIESRKQVRTTHTENPAFMITLDSESFDENYGEVIAGALAWSGNFRLNFEVDEFNVLNILAGANPYASDYTLGAGESFTTPEMIYTYSSEGAGGASRHLHDWARNYGVWHGHTYAPTLLNSWEGAYFTFDAKTLTEMIDDAADMGLEMFVLDDGWFGNKYPRNDSNAGLGDWQVNAKKLPEGIDYIASYAHQKGMKFGIWIEPEMVNPKSELFEKHPDWAIHLPNRETYYYRNQLVLDLSNPKVQDYVFSVVDNIMIENPDLAFFKWDCNSPITNVYSPYLKEKQNQLYIDHVRGVYNVFKRVAEKYPHLPIMLCSGGGARCDYEALKYFTEFWCSDNTDPIERLYIQWGFSQFFPAKAMCAHVTSWNKNTSVKFRTDVAMMCKMGFDISLKEMNDDEMKYCQEAVANYKRLKGTILDGDLYRLVSPYETNHSSVMYVDKAKSKSVLFAYDIHPRFGEKTFPVKLQGLAPNKKYKVQEINLMPGKKSALATDGGTFSGDFLMKIGLNVFSTAHARSKVIELTEVH